jgi:hypothetical protein
MGCGLRNRGRPAQPCHLTGASGALPTAGDLNASNPRMQNGPRSSILRTGDEQVGRGPSTFNGTTMRWQPQAETESPGQSGYGKRLRAQGGMLAAVITELARDTASWHDQLRLLDSTPLPCSASRETVKRAAS